MCMHPSIAYQELTDICLMTFTVLSALASTAACEHFRLLAAGATEKLTMDVLRQLVDELLG